MTDKNTTQSSEATMLSIWTWSALILAIYAVVLLFQGIYNHKTRASEETLHDQSQFALLNDVYKATQGEPVFAPPEKDEEGADKTRDLRTRYQKAIHALVDHALLDEKLVGEMEKNKALEELFASELTVENFDPDVLNKALQNPEISVFFLRKDVASLVAETPIERGWITRMSDTSPDIWWPLVIMLLAVGLAFAGRAESKGQKQPA